MSIKVRLIIIALLIAIVSITSLSYAFFAADVNGNSSTGNTIITSGYMEVTFEDGDVIGTTSTMIPGDYVIKKFTIKNTGTVDSEYNIHLTKVLNSFNTKSDLVCELTSDNGINKIEITCPSDDTIIANNEKIRVNETHNYTLKVLFKNFDRNQDDNKGKAFKTKIALEEDNSVDYIADQIKDKKILGATDLEYDGLNVFGDYKTVDNNLRYVGANPNNYIYFNCSTINTDEMNDETCEKWRIIGVFNNVEDENGNKATRVKITKNENFGKYVYDTTDSSVNNGYGINQWGESIHTKDNSIYEGSDIMRELNTDYLGNITVGTDGKWYSGPLNRKTFDMPTSMLNENTINMIQTVKWYTGAIPSRIYSNIGIVIAGKTYSYERENYSPKLCGGGFACTDDVKRTSTWIGKVALPSPSDYLFSVISGDNTKRYSCLAANVDDWYIYSSTQTNDCPLHSWLYQKDSYFFLSPAAHNTGNLISTVNNAGNLGSINDDGNNQIKPTVFLKSDIRISSGDGSITNPYKISI